MQELTNIERKVLHEMKDYLINIASKWRWGDIRNCDYSVTIGDLSGGNQDDAYYGGMDTGETYLAREILRKFFEMEITPKEEDT